MNDFSGNFSNIDNLYPAKYILHKRADRRGTISVFSDNDYANIVLHGDKTDFIDDTGAKLNGIQDIIDKINNARVFRR